MSKIVNTVDAEFLEAADVNNLGLFPRAAIDNVVGDAIGYANGWAGYTVSRKSAQLLTVSPGRFFEGAIIYTREDAEDLNLTIYFPTDEDDERWLAILPRGEVVVIKEDRNIDTSTDPETQLPVEIQTPTIESRTVKYTVLAGAAGPSPAAKPQVSDTDACLAYVLVTTQGIQTIEPGNFWRVKSLAEVEGRVTSLELRITQLFEETASIRTDVANIAAGQKNIPDPRLVAQMVRDVARHNQALNMPDEARNYFFDQALLKEFWDFTLGGYFRIKEGIRFQYASQKDSILRLLNYDDPQLKVHANNLVLPAYTEVTRITSPEGTGRQDISNIVHTIVTAVQHTVAHESIRYGETINVCENTAGWGSLGSQQYGAAFQANGETWVNYGQTSNPWNQTETAQNGHTEYAVARLIVDTYYETYTTYNTEYFGLDGAIYGQTFLNSQVSVATSVDLYFTKVDQSSDDSDVMLCLCQVNASAAPAFDAILTKVIKPKSQLKVGWNNFPLPPALLEQGKRYGWFVVSSGNHQLMTNDKNAYTGGSKFVCTDGAWAQGTVTEDFTFRLNVAKFKQNRTVVQFESIGPLENGMTEIEMVYKRWRPAATQLSWEIKAQGDTEWIPLDAREDNPLANLPPLVQIRLVFVGTQDVAPAIILDQYARAVCGRMRLDMRAFSKLKTFGFSTDEARIVLQMDNFDPAKHTAVPMIVLANNTVVTATAIVAETDITKPSRVKITADFNLPAGTTQVRARVDATTTSVTDVPFGQDIQIIGY
ncbi:hypothetical protein [Rhizobium sp. SSA_523]|uniref:hypothetical protein n=1 Tax=Rhizobium sp. SSA_523 TaxID=2952477 RepID=UPI00209139C7|nr:hypothetical protein [Rhizobium sp. SSA_523]MCO5734131.1 hypothetical protein [Rhizobium sp. SSA_523]WKC24768.1 hypothetical protein QTJ18_12130 [Rhizobium sp. SSA_523]